MRILGTDHKIGIHGYPFTPWQYPPSATVNPGLGYCSHSSAIFLPWHTPYLLLMEVRLALWLYVTPFEANNKSQQILWREAGDIARQFTGAQRDRYVAAANRVRLPYWDWASPGSQSRIPPILKQSQITVVKPGVGSRTIHNPLYSYRFLRDPPPPVSLAEFHSTGTSLSHSRTDFVAGLPGYHRPWTK